MNDARAGRVLVVDDEPQLLRLHARALTQAGYEVETAADGVAAEARLAAGRFDMILSDVDMPGLDGVGLLERVRRTDGDVPVALITGLPSFDAAVKAVEFGAIRYLVKPVEIPTLLGLVDDGVRSYRRAKAKRRVVELAGGVEKAIEDEEALSGAFERALESLFIAYQPIVSWARRSVFAFEALLRTREPTFPHPGALIEAAERLGRTHDLGRCVRARASRPVVDLPADVLLFVNLHPSDLLDDELFASDSELTRIASRVVLEITERASLDTVSDVRGRIAALRALGFRVAVDDLGAGYAGLTSLTLLEPDVVKLDMGLVRGLHLSPKKQTLVRSMITMCRELGAEITGEGIETPDERDALASAGCDLMQGWLFAKAGPAFPAPAFELLRPPG